MASGQIAILRVILLADDGGAALAAEGEGQDGGRVGDAGRPGRCSPSMSRSIASGQRSPYTVMAADAYLLSYELPAR